MIKRLSGNREFLSDNRKWLGIVAIAFALCSAMADAQQQAKVAKIGWIVSGAASQRDVFERELRALGWIEGKNIAFEHRSAENKLDRLAALAEDLVRLKVDVLVTSSTSASLAAKNATRTIAIVMIGVTDPVAAGLVDSLARPGGNITGVTNIGAVLAGKRMEMLKETGSRISRIGLLWNPQDPASALQWKESQLPARELGLQLHSMEVMTASNYQISFKDGIKARIDGLAVSQDALAATHQKQIVDLAAKHRLPAIYPRADFAVSGGLMSYGPDRGESFKRAAWMIDKILKGARPADIPVEQPMKFELIINLKTAKALGLTIPPIVLMRATKVIK